MKLSFANKAQESAVGPLPIQTWMRLERLTHLAVPVSEALGGALCPTEKQAQIWAAVADGRPDEQAGQAIELACQLLLEGRARLSPDAPEEVKYLLGRALRVAHPWPKFADGPLNLELVKDAALEQLGNHPGIKRIFLQSAKENWLGKETLYFICLPGESCREKQAAIYANGDIDFDEANLDFSHPDPELAPDAIKAIKAFHASLGKAPR